MVLFTYIVYPKKYVKNQTFDLSTQRVLAAKHVSMLFMYRCFSLIIYLEERTATLNWVEKRKMDRFVLELPAWISVINESEKPWAFEAVSRNICAGGVFLQTDQPLTVGSVVEMNLILPLDNLSDMEDRRSRIEVAGTVVRSESEGMAVRFDKKYQISPMA